MDQEWGDDDVENTENQQHRQRDDVDNWKTNSNTSSKLNTQIEYPPMATPD